MGIYVVVGLVLGIYLFLTYILGSLFGLQASNLWIFRIVLGLIGILIAVAYMWSRFGSFRNMFSGRRKRKSKGATAAADGDLEIDDIIREADARIAQSELGKKAKISKLPLLLVVGKAGSTKTSTVVHSGLHPDLLSGHVYRDSTIVPTATANLWYAERSVFAEAGGRVIDDPAEWKRLLKKLRPGVIASLFGARQDAPRAALVCVSCEQFVQSGAGEALAATARELRAKLEEASRVFGVQLPTYVLFTKADRIAFFSEYVRNMSDRETGQVVGVTLPLEGDESTGVYAERQSSRLTKVFDNLIYGLSDRRTDLLAREHEDAGLPPVYEFPRELRKLRSNLVQFLVDLCRPSQLTAGPFLRGFYVSGVRAVMVREEAVQRPRAADEGRDIEAATMVFTPGQTAQAAAPGAPQAVTRKKPQWVFLTHLFHDVLLRDGLAEQGGASVKKNRLRRLALITATVLCFFWIIGLIVSYIGNSRLENRALEAMEGIAATEAGGGELASVEALTRLDTLRQSLETITDYETDGHPWRLCWGLYTGDDLYPSVRRAYYTRFHQLLFGSTQASLLGMLQRLPDRPSPTDQYTPAYDALKAYLITTSHPDKSTREFLSPVLMSHWMRAREVDEERMTLAQSQFDFYADDLTNSNPFSSEEDALGVERGRRYLSQFAGAESVYQAMLAEASRQNPSVNFNRLFPGSDRVVINNREVPGAFTKNAWAFMQDAILHADRYFGGEEWVLGRPAASTMDAAELAAQLGQRYRVDFINQWLLFLRETNVVRYRSLSDAASKLSVLSGNQSPLLAAIWLASRNTAVENEDVSRSFQPVQFVVPPESEDRYIAESNTNYMQALLGLQASMDQVAAVPRAQRDQVVGQVNTQASQAKVVTRQVAQNFRIDPETKIETTVQQLMEKPILYAEALVRALGPGELNAKGRSLCAQFRSLLRKYPFKPDATTEATLAEVAAVFQPGSGSLWTLYEEDLREHLTRQGSLYAANPSSRIRRNPAFVNFFNRAAAFGEAVYPGGSSQARLSFQLTGHPAEGIPRLNLTVENQVLRVSRQPAAGTFVWPGSGNQVVRLTGRFGSGPELAFTSYQGLWAVFRFFGDADRWRTSGDVHRLEWVLRQGRAGRPLTLPDGRPLTVRFDLQAAAPVFWKDFLAGLSCVSTVAR